MAKEIMIPILQAINVTQWIDAGFKGQGIKVWNAEADSGHGEISKQMIIDVAPEVIVLSESISHSDAGDVFVKPPTLLSNGMGLKEFIDLKKPQIFSASIGGTLTSSKCWHDYTKEIQDRTHATIFNSAGNDGSGEADTLGSWFPTECAILIGALDYRHDVFIRSPYSSIGKELDFTQSIGWWAGTSASTPFQAGMAAIIMSRYGFMSNIEMYQYLKMIAKDLGDSGVDNYYGWGQPILPHLNKKYITMKVGDCNYRVDGKTQLMDTVPVNKESNVFVPLRAISESLGYAVEWNAPNIVIDGRVKLTIGSNVLFVDGRKVFLNFAPYIDFQNRTLVPVRAIAEAFGCKVDWVQSEKKVMILEV